MNELNGRSVRIANQRLYNAQGALELAKHNLGLGECKRAGLQAHETIELSFKAALRWQGNPKPTKTHVLVTLYDDMIDVLPSIADSIGYLFPRLEDILQYYVDPRSERSFLESSDTITKYDEEAARVAVDTAQTIYQTIRNLIPQDDS